MKYIHIELRPLAVYPRHTTTYTELLTTARGTIETRKTLKNMIILPTEFFIFHMMIEQDMTFFNSGSHTYLID